MKFEINIREDMERLSHHLDDYCTVETLEFEEKKEKSSQVAKVTLDLVYVNNPTVFIDHIIKKQWIRQGEGARKG